MGNFKFAEMLYVVVRQIENWEREQTRDHHVFVLLDQAKAYYEEAQNVCWNGPSGGPGDDPSVVTNCWLWASDTPDPVAAAQLALSQKATLLAECFPPGSS
jgi:hypothetical protein